MADPEKPIGDRIRELLAPKQPGGALKPPAANLAPPLAGFTYGIGHRVLDLVSGERGTVVAAYYGSAVGRVYEIALEQTRQTVVRPERELERDRPIAPAPPAVPR